MSRYEVKADYDLESQRDVTLTGFSRSDEAGRFRGLEARKPEPREALEKPDVIRAVGELGQGVWALVEGGFWCV